MIQTLAIVVVALWMAAGILAKMISRNVLSKLRNDEPKPFDDTVIYLFLGPFILGPVLRDLAYQLSTLKPT